MMKNYWALRFRGMGTYAEYDGFYFDGLMLSEGENKAYLFDNEYIATQLKQFWSDAQGWYEIIPV